jgi:molybdopterin converting factor subunit 1
MNCEVLLFAQLREAIGCERLSLALNDGATVGDALDALAHAHPIIASMHGALAVAVDENYQPASARLHEGCTIALIPPVSGG